jgi:hypothetical protein
VRLFADRAWRFTILTPAGFRQDGAVATPVVFLQAQERDAFRGGQFAQRFEFQNRLRLLEMLGENSGISPIRSGPLHAPPSASPARGGEGNRRLRR